MKNLILLITLFVFAGLTNSALAQIGDERNDIQYYTPPSQLGLNQFEAPFTTDVEFDGVYVRLGGANTIQFQGLSNDNAGPWQTGVDDNGNPVMSELPELTTNFNLPTSNLDFDVALAPGMRMHLRTYLSSQHHSEAWVKGGYLQMDRLDFIQEDFLGDIMDHVRVKVGLMEINYGDNHFRRSDNGMTVLNPFVGNYIMDSFTTEVGGEVYVYGGDYFGMIGVTNGKLNQSTVKGQIDVEPSYVFKLGYDSQINDDLRLRLTGSAFIVTSNPSIYLYSGDRAGSRYYNVMDGGFRSGRFAPSFTPGYGQPAAAGEMTAIMVNPFVKFNGLEFYGVFETVSGKAETESDTRSYTQLGGELLYRFGSEEDFYLGTRYNTVSGEQPGGSDVDVNRFNIGAGWFMTQNVLAKIEYVTQTYDGFTRALDEGEFSGVMIEAAISF